MPQAVSYIRFSTINQARGSTTDRQKDRVSEWLEKNENVKLSNLSREDPGISGYQSQNLKHGLGKILQAIEIGKIKSGDYLLIEALDRLGRDEPLDMIKRCEKIISKGVKIITLEDNQEYSNKTIAENPSILQNLLGKIIQSNNYSRQLSYRIHEAYQNKRKMAAQGEKIRISNAYWLNKDGSLNPERSNHVKLCIDLYLKGYGTFKIFEIMTSKYPETQTINPATIRRWLKSPSLKGVWWNQGNPIENVFQPLIDDLTYIQLQNEIKERSRNPKKTSTYVLSGLIKCRKCGKSYHFRRKVYKEDVIVYCHCSTYLKKGKNYCQNNSSKPYEVMLAILEETLESSLERFTTQQVTRKLSLFLSEKKYEKENLKEQQKISYKVIQRTGGDDEFAMQKYLEVKEQLKKIEGEIKKLEESIEKESREFLTYDQVRSANDLYEKLASNPKELNASLIKVNYKILCSPYSAIFFGEKNLEAYVIKRRSQKYKCYIVKKRHSSIQSDGRKNTNSCFYAIDRVGVLSIASTESDLFRKLEERKSYILNNEIHFAEDVYFSTFGNIEARNHDEGRKISLMEALEAKLKNKK